MMMITPTTRMLLLLLMIPTTTTMTTKRCVYLGKYRVSWMVSGRLRPLVSGRKNVMMDTVIPVNPNTTWGRAGPHVPFTNMF
jgi:hypothetical protein